MKRTLIYLAAALLTFAACEPDNTIITPKEEGEDPSGKPSTEGYIKLDTAICTCYGDYYENGTTNFYFEFDKDAAYDEEGYMTKGLYISLELLADANLEMFPEGSYKIDDSGKAGTILASEPCTMGEYIDMAYEYYEGKIDKETLIEYYFGEDYEEDGLYGIYGSNYYYMNDGDDEASYKLITGGTVSYYIDGTTVTVLMDLVAGKETLKYYYEGEITVEFDEDDDDDDDDDDDSGDDDEDLGDVTFNPVTVYAYNYGEDYGTLDKSYYDWCIYMYGTDTSDDADMVEIDVFSDQSLASDVLPTGKFSIKDDGSYYLYEPGCALPFYYDEKEGYGYGCHFAHKNCYWYAASEGDVEITKENGVYTITYSMYDADADATFSGSFTGSVTVIDESSDEESVAASRKACSKCNTGTVSASNRRNTFNNEKISVISNGRFARARR